MALTPDSTCMNTYLDQIAARLQRRFRHGGYGVGDRLPSLRDLAEEYDLKINILRRAIARLVEQGVVVQEQGRGTFLSRLPDVPAPTGSLLVLLVGVDRRDGFVVRVLDALSASADRAGHPLETQLISAPAEIAPAVRTTAPAGVVMIGRHDESHHQALLATGGAFVSLGSGRGVRPPRGCSWVSNEDRAGIYHATQHLLAMGHRRITCLAPSIDAYYVNDRIEGWRDALADGGLHPDLDDLIRAPTLDRTGAASAWATMQLHRQRPTAVVALDDGLALDLIQVVTAEGLHVPDDLSITGFGEQAEDGSDLPRLTTVAIDLSRVGSALINLLVERWTGHPPREQRIPVRLALGRTTAPPGGPRLSR